MTTFIQTVEGDIVAVAQAAWDQTKAELQTLEQAVLSEIRTDIQALVSSIEQGQTVEQIETALLNLWSAEKPQIISALTSGALQILIAAARTLVAAI